MKSHQLEIGRWYAVVVRMWAFRADAVVPDEQLGASGFDPSAPTPEPRDYL